MTVAVPYEISDMVMREVGNGVWACLSIFLIVGFMRYAILRGLYTWRHDPTVCGALALSLYFAGSAIRTMLTWGSIAALLRGWSLDPWLAMWPWYGGSIIASVIGAAWCIWIFAPDTYRGPAVFIVVLISLAVPIAVRIFV